MQFSDDEVKAIETMLPAMGAFVAEKDLGEKTFNTMERDEILGLFATTIKTFRQTFHDNLEGEAPF